MEAKIISKNNKDQSINKYERNSKQLNFILNQINVIIYSYQHSMKKYQPRVFKILPA
jgi:hypothetical protein